MLSSLCGKRSKPGVRFSGKCTKLVSKRRGACCVQDDLSFLRSAAKIYANREDTVTENKELEKITTFLTTSDIDVNEDHVLEVDASTRNGNLLVQMVNDLTPVRETMKFRYITSQFSAPNRVYYMFHYFESSILLENVIAFNLPLAFKMTIDGELDSSVQILSHPLFNLSKMDGDHVMEFVGVTPGGYMNINASVHEDFETLTGTIGAELPKSMDMILLQGELNGNLSEDEYTLIMPRFSSSVNVEKEFTRENAGWRVDASYTNTSENFRVHVSVSKKAEEVVNLEEVRIPKSVLDKESVDVISLETVKAGDFLEESDDHIVFVDGGVVVLVNKNDIDIQSNVFYECKEANSRLMQDPENVVSSVELFNGRTIGVMSGYLMASELRAAMEIPSRIVKVERLRSIPSVISRAVFRDGASLVSASHCQPGQEGSVASLKAVTLE